MNWLQITTDDYRSSCGRWNIKRIPATATDFNDRDEFILSDGITPIEVFPYIYDAKRFAEEMNRLGNDSENS
jgi:hypothetical protein